ncbi:hypothetical protein EV714DRAFT_219475, partial [Schizophyllum commune]
SATKPPDEVRHILDEFRQALHDNAERPYWTPTPQKGEEDTTPAWREHVAQFKLMPIGGFYGSPAKPALARNTHAHISKEASETIEHNIAHVSRKGEPTFLVNSEGAGKTATLLQGLRKHWGFFLRSWLGEFGSGALREFVFDHGSLSSPVRSLPFVEKRLQRLIVAHLLLLHAFAETVGVMHPTDKARDLWNSVHLSFQYGSDFLLRLWKALNEPGPIALDREATIIRNSVSSLRELLGHDDFHVFCVFDNTECYQDKRIVAIDLEDGTTHWERVDSFIGNVCTGLPWLTPVFSGACRGSASNVRPSLRVVSSTGFSSPEHVRAFLRSYLPPSLVATDAGQLLLERAGAWLRGRHKFVAEFVQFLLKGAPMTVVDAPHTYLHQFLRSQAHFIPQDDIELVADKGTDRCGFWIESNHEQDVRERNFNESPQARAMLHHILYQYLVLGHSKRVTLGPDFSWLVYSGLGYFADDDAHKLIYNPDQPAFASAREHAVLLLSRIFATPRGPAEAFSFPGEEAPEWAHRYSDLVELRPGVWNNGDARYRTARHADYPASAVLPPATDGTSYATTLSWLRHEHETAFCLLPDPTAFIFALRRFDGDYLWVIVRVGPSAYYGPHKSGLGRYFVGRDKTADTSEALSRLAALPNPCKALGDFPVLEVAMPTPDPNAPNRLDRIDRRWETLYSSPSSPKPTKYRTVTMNPTLAQFTEAVLEEETLTVDQGGVPPVRSSILTRIVANIVGETSISPDRHGRRRKMVSRLSQHDASESTSSRPRPRAQTALLDDSPSNVTSTPSSQHAIQSEQRDANYILTRSASKRKRSESLSAESDQTSNVLDRVELPSSCKRCRVDSQSPTS